MKCSTEDRAWPFRCRMLFDLGLLSPTNKMRSSQCPSYDLQRFLAVIVYVFSTYHLMLSLNVDHQSRNESVFSASNRRNPLYSVPQAWLYSPINSTSPGKEFFISRHCPAAFCASSLFIDLYLKKTRNVAAIAGYETRN